MSRTLVRLKKVVIIFELFRLNRRLPLSRQAADRAEEMLTPASSDAGQGLKIQVDSLCYFFRHQFVFEPLIT